jgi:hypothetical protein
VKTITALVLATVVCLWAFVMSFVRAEPRPARPLRRTTPPRRKSQPVTVRIDYRPVSFLAGTRAGRPAVVGEVEISHHQVVAGSTGSGKSVFCQLQFQRIVIDGLRGGCYIDFDGDSIDQLMAYCARTAEDEGTDAIARQVIYIEMGFDRLPGLDHFLSPDFSEVPEERRETAYEAWLRTAVDEFIKLVQAAQGEDSTAGRARLERTLRTVLYAVGKAVDATGRHLPLSAVFTVLDCDATSHAETLALVWHALPDDIRAEFLRWRNAPRQQRLAETESALNRLRSCLSGLALAAMSEPYKRVDWRDVLDSKKIVLCNLRQSDFLSEAGQKVIAALVINCLWTAAKKVKRSKRRRRPPFHVYVDESHLLKECGGAMLESILTRGRKFKISLTLICQFVGQFRTEKIDMVPALLNLCRTCVCFRHTDPDDLAVLKQVFGYPNLDFTELYQVADRPDGYDVIRLKDYARNWNTARTWNFGVNAGTADGTSDAKMTGRAHTDGEGEDEGEAESETSGGDATSVSRDNKGVLRGRNTSTREPGKSRSKSKRKSRQSSDTTNEAETHAKTTQKSAGVSAGGGGSQSGGGGETIKQTLVPRTREEWHPTGRLRVAVADQLDKVHQRLNNLPDRHAFVRLHGVVRTFVLKVADVPDVYEDLDEMDAAVEAFKAKVYAAHPDTYFTPDLSPNAASKRLAAWAEQRPEESAPTEDAMDDEEESEYGY